MYKVDINGNKNSDYGLNRSEYETGERVEFEFPLQTDTRTFIVSHDVEVTKCVDGHMMRCDFIMPERDVSIKITMKSNMMGLDIRSPFAMDNLGMGNAKPVIPQCDAMHCYSCGAFLPVTARYCSNCGKKCRE